jgi:hypothetical protein
MERARGFRFQHWGGRDHAHSLSRVDFGWPFLSLRYVARQSPDPAEGGADFLVTVTKPDGTGLSLPLLPLCPGFALDTALYGAIVFALWSAPVLLRRRYRLQHGACPRCNYDLRGCTAEVCPECGAATISHAYREGPAA